MLFSLKTKQIFNAVQALYVFFLSYLEKEICEITDDVENKNEQKQSPTVKDMCSIKGMESAYLIFAGQVQQI